MERYHPPTTESILSISWIGNQVAYCTPNTLYIDDDIWSFGSSLGDCVRIQECRGEGGYVAYAGVDRLQGRYDGVVVIMDAKKGRRCVLRHVGCGARFWRVLRGGLVVSVGGDFTIRVWKVAQPHDDDGGEVGVWEEVVVR